MIARALVLALALALFAAPGAARGDSVTGAQLRELARDAAAGDGGARQRLDRVDRVDGQEVDVREALRGARGDELRERLQQLEAGAPRGGRTSAGAREQARDVLDDRRYTGTDVPRPFTGVLEWVGDLIEPIFDWIGDRLDDLPGPPGFWYFGLALAVLVGASLLAARVINRGPGGGDGGGGRLGAGDLGPADDPRALERAAAEAERDGDWELAVRLRFRAGLLRLDERDAIAYRPSLTTGEVARAIRLADVRRSGRPLRSHRLRRRACGRARRRRPARRLAARAGGGGRAMRRLLRRFPLPESQSGRFAVGLLALIVAFAVLASVIDFFAPSPSGPQSSSYSTSPAGLAAWAELLEREGRVVRALRAAPSDDSLPQPPGTVVILDPDALIESETDALRRFAQRGGRVVAGGNGAGYWGALLVDDDELELTFGGPQTTRVLAPAPETAGVSTVFSAGRGVWTAAGGTLPVLGTRGDEALLLVARVENGRIALLADSSPLHNERLDQADNAALALALAGPEGTTVTFVEAVHGYGEARGLGALPTRFKWALWLLALAALLLMVARGRRLGPPEAQARSLPPPRRAYVDAVAVTLQRAKRREAAVAPVRAAARARVRRRAGLSEDASEDALVAAAARLGLDERETAALSARAESDEDVLAVGTALAKLERR